MLCPLLSVPWAWTRNELARPPTRFGLLTPPRLSSGEPWMYFVAIRVQRFRSRTHRTSFVVHVKPPISHTHRYTCNTEYRVMNYQEYVAPDALKFEVCVYQSAWHAQQGCYRYCKSSRRQRADRSGGWAARLFIQMEHGRWRPQPRLWDSCSLRRFNVWSLKTKIATAECRYWYCLYCYPAILQYSWILAEYHAFYSIRKWPSSTRRRYSETWVFFVFFC